MPNSKKGHGSRPKPAAPARSAQQPVSDDEKLLWSQVRQGDEGAVEQLVELHQGIAHFMANAHLGRGIALAELADEATQALRRAICEFDVARSENFPAFANVLVRNSLADLFRGGSLQSRHEREQSARFHQAELALASKMGRKPLLDETYAELGWGKIEQRNHGFAEQRRTFKRLTHMEERTGKLPKDKKALEPDAELQAAQDLATHEAENESLHLAIAELDAQSRAVIVERYLNPAGLTKQQIAQKMKITEYRLEKTESQALLTLRDKMEDSNASHSREANEIDGRSAKERTP